MFDRAIPYGDIFLKLHIYEEVAAIGNGTKEEEEKREGRGKRRREKRKGKDGDYLALFTTTK